MNESLFTKRVIELQPDAEGKVVATLLRYTPSISHEKAVLYIHGFVDYFFHEHVAEFFHQQGWAFYAIDLRKYGRSILPHQTPNYTNSISEYYEELSIATEEIKAKHNFLLLQGHSTGGLVAPLFVAETKAGDLVDALLLNSPFFAMNYPPFICKTAVPLLAWVGSWAPRANLYARLSKLYGMSLHSNFHGEWNYNLAWKPVTGFVVYTGWIRAILQAQKRLQNGLDLSIPSLVLHSDKSIDRIFGWKPDLLEADAVLNVASMDIYAKKLANNVTVKAIQKAIHDVFLSKLEAREQAFKEVANWLPKL